MKVRLLGSSPTLEGLGEVIKSFYCGEPKTLQEAPEGWTVHFPDGRRLTSVRVTLKKGRYRFEAVS